MANNPFEHLFGVDTGPAIVPGAPRGPTAPLAAPSSTLPSLGIVGGFMRDIFGPTATRAQAEQKAAQAPFAAEAYRALASRIQKGMQPAAAVVDFLSSSEGASLLANSPDGLMEGIRQFQASMEPQMVSASPGTTVFERNRQSGRLNPQVTIPQYRDVPEVNQLGEPTGRYRREEITGEPRFHDNRQQQQEGQPQTSAAQPRLPSLEQMRNAITDNEWDRAKFPNPYVQIGPNVTRNGRTDNALGRYQIMRSNLPSWSKEVFGREVSEKEFLETPQIQDQIFDYKFSQLVRQYGHEGAAVAWFTGRPNAMTARDVTGTSGADYLQRYRAGLQRHGYNPNTGAVPAQAQAQGQAPIQGQAGNIPVVPGAPGVGTRMTAPQGPQAQGQGTQRPTTLWERASRPGFTITGPIASGTEALDAISPFYDWIPGLSSPASQQFLQDREAFGLASQKFLMNIALSKRYPASELNRLQDRVGLDVRFFKSPAALQSKLIQVDEYLATEIKAEEEIVTKGIQVYPKARVAEAISSLKALREFKAELGVPPEAKIGGTPKADEEIDRIKRQEQGAFDRSQIGPWVEGIIKDVEAGKPISAETIKRLTQIPAQQRQQIIERIEAARKKGEK